MLGCDSTEEIRFWVQGFEGDTGKEIVLSGKVVGFVDILSFLSDDTLFEGVQVLTIT